MLVLGVVWFLLFAFLPFGRKILLSESVLQVVFFLLIYAAAAFALKMPAFSSPYMLPVIIPSAFYTLIVAILYGQLSSVLAPSGEAGQIADDAPAQRDDDVGAAHAFMGHRLEQFAEGGKVLGTLPRGEGKGGVREPGIGQAVEAGSQVEGADVGIRHDEGPAGVPASARSSPRSAAGAPPRPRRRTLTPR